MRFFALVLALLLPLTAYPSGSPILWNAGCASGAFNAAEHSCLVAVSAFSVDANGAMTIGAIAPQYAYPSLSIKGSTGNGTSIYMLAGNDNGPVQISVGINGYLSIQDSGRNILQSDASGHVGLGNGSADGPTNFDTVNIANQGGETLHNSLGISVLGGQTGDALVVWSSTTKIARIESSGKADVVGLSNAGHETSTQVGTTTATVDAHAGTGATCVVAHATDVAGEITLVTTAIGPAAGSECAVGFASAYGTAPICVIWPANAAAILNAVVVGFYVTASTSALTINAANSDVTGGTYKLNYRCTETQ